MILQHESLGMAGNCNIRKFLFSLSIFVLIIHFMNTRLILLINFEVWKLDP